ncbi:hypothetical protein VPH35_023615 [Triticum aestivum]
MLRWRVPLPRGSRCWWRLRRDARLPACSDAAQTLPEPPRDETPSSSSEASEPPIPEDPRLEEIRSELLDSPTMLEQWCCPARSPPHSWSACSSRGTSTGTYARACSAGSCTTRTGSWGTGRSMRCSKRCCASPSGGTRSSAASWTPPWSPTSSRGPTTDSAAPMPTCDWV